MSISTKFKSFTDSGHGWLKVLKSELLELGIANKITKYSYQRGDYAYLEEDCDMTTFMDAWEAKTGLKWDAKQHTEDSYSDRSAIRNYERYQVPTNNTYSQCRCKISADLKEIVFCDFHIKITNLYLKMVQTFPGLKNGDDEVNGGDLVEFLNMEVLP